MATEVPSEQQYDLTSVIGGYLDRHLVFPMLEFLSEKKVLNLEPVAFTHSLYTLEQPKPVVHIHKDRNMTTVSFVSHYFTM